MNRYDEAELSESDFSDISYVEEDITLDESMSDSNAEDESGVDRSQESVAASDEEDLPVADTFHAQETRASTSSDAGESTESRPVRLTRATSRALQTNIPQRSSRIDLDNDDDDMPVVSTRRRPHVATPPDEPEDDDIVILPQRNHDRAPAVESSSSSGSDTDADELVVRRGRKRRRTEEQEDTSRADADEVKPSTSTTAVNGDVEEEDEDYGCTICYEDFTNAGDHRLVSLKCGHFFGRNCIERWVRSEGKAATCPTCKGRTTLRDIRNHFTKTIKQTDTSELESLKVSNAEYCRKVAELELSCARKDSEIKKLTRELNNKNIPRVVQIPTSDVRPGKIEFQAGSRIYLNSETSHLPQARAFDFNGKSFALGVATSSNVTLFNKYAIRMGSWNQDNKQMSLGQSLPLHANRPRFVVFSPWEQALVLSGGEDKKAVIHNLGSRSIRKEWTVPGSKQIWSGCWTSPNTIVVGTIDGRIWEYDMESTSTEPIRDLTNGVGNIPVVFLAADIITGAVLAGTFKKVFIVHGETTYPLLSSTEDQFDKIRSISWDEQRMVFSVSFNPGGRHPAMSHRLYKLELNIENAIVESVECVELATWNTSCMMHSTLWSNSLFYIGENLLSVAFNEDKKMLDIHDWSGRRPDVSVKFSSVGNATMMKVAPISMTEKTVFVLTEKSLSAFTVQISS